MSQTSSFTAFETVLLLCEHCQ